MSNIKIPTALILVVDDVGWHNGRDDRLNNRPSRSGLPRFHHKNDVLALNEIGRGLDMKIVCSLVIGEWDRKNILRGVPHVTWDEEGWDAAGIMDKEYTEEYFRALEDSEYLDYSLHGLLHGYYENGKLISELQYYPLSGRDADGKRIPRWLPSEEFEKMLSLFFDIYNDWGFKKKIVTFVSPCGCLGTPKDAGNIEYARIIRKYGMIYWNNGWPMFDGAVDTVGGVITSKSYSLAPWNAYDVDPSALKLFITEDSTDIRPTCCEHLTNFVRFNPKKNFEGVRAWVDYFKRQAEVFGVMLARDNAFSCSQTLYSKYAKIEECDGKYVIDLSAVDAIDAVGKKNEFYVSLKNGEEPKSSVGGEVSLYEVKENFKTYKIVRDGSNTVELFVK